MKIIKVIIVSMAVAVIVGCFSTKKNTTDLAFYCSFDSTARIQCPEVGPEASLVTNVSLVSGVEGKALSVPPFVPCLSYVLPKGFLGRKGCIEFWGKILNDNDHGISDGGNPRFFCIKWESKAEALIDFNTNNGGGDSGFHAMLPGFNLTSHKGRSSHSYSDLLKGSDWRDWKHYAVTWNEDGISSLSDKPRIAVFVNGSLYTMRGIKAESHVVLKTMSEESATLDIPRNPTNGFPGNNKVPYLIDEFKIWKTDKTSFDLK